MDLNLIISCIAIVIGLISIFYAIIISRRFAGKLKISVIFLIGMVVVFTIKEALKVYSLLTMTNTEVFKSIANIIIILLVLTILYCMQKMVDRVNNHIIK